MIIDSLTNGGAQTQFTRIAQALSRRGFGVRVFTYAPYHFHKEALACSNIALSELHKRHRFDLTPAWRLSSHNRQHAPDVVLAFLRTPSIYAELARFRQPGIPLVVSERTGVLKTGPVARDYAAALGHIAATAVVSNSYAYHDRVLKRIPLIGRKSRVIYNGIDPSMFELGRAQLQHPPNQVLNKKRTLGVLSARLSPEKGALNFIEALAKLAPELKEKINVNWVGPVDTTTAHYTDVRRALESHGLTDLWAWRGETSFVAKEIQHFDALVLPSLFEGTSNSLCEAMALGVPVITTNVGDAHHIVGSEAGMVCDSENPQALSDALTTFLSMTEADCRALSESAYLRAQSLFELDRVVDQWEEVLRGSINQA